MGALNSSAAFRELIAWVSTKLGNSLIISGLFLENLNCHLYTVQ